jgi:hypothetical protein
MSLVGPVLTVNSERITNALFRGRRKKSVEAVPAPAGGAAAAGEEAIALMEGATGNQDSSQNDAVESENDEPLLGSDAPTAASGNSDDDDADDEDVQDLLLDPTIQQAMEQSDQQSSRKRDPEY